MNMGPVTLPNHFVTIEDVNEIGDTSPEVAITKATQLIRGGFQVDAVWCDPKAGTVIISPTGNYHFKTATCGYDNDAARAAAVIIEIAGFSNFVHAYQELSWGGDDSRSYFDHQQRAR
ncbi:MAG: hypothetical protein ABI397_02930 [Candidatus Saccharimonas sp.]